MKSKPNGRWLLILVALLFVGYVIYGTASRAEVSCEVCLEFEGELVCRRGAGPTEEAASRAAQESTCGGNAIGMSESTECRNRPPVRKQCTTG